MREDNVRNFVAQEGNNEEHLKNKDPFKSQKGSSAKRKANSYEAFDAECEHRVIRDDLAHRPNTL